MPSHPILHRLRLALIQTLWVLLALGPFLHAHYGSSRLTGFHVDEVSQAVAHAAMAQHTTDSERALTQADSPESPALGVSTSHTREVRDTALDNPGHASLHGTAFATRTHSAVHVTWRAHVPTSTRPAWTTQGSPPPALAPPAQHA